MSSHNHPHVNGGLISSHIRVLSLLDDAKHDKKVQRMLIYDIYKKYNIDKSLWTNKHIYTFSINVLRELLVFGEHEHIIDKIKGK